MSHGEGGNRRNWFPKPSNRQTGSTKKLKSNIALFEATLNNGLRRRHVTPLSKEGSTICFQCPYCSEKFQQSVELEHHLNIHMPHRRFKCRPHAIRADNGIRERQCDFCMKEFPCNKSLKAHLRFCVESGASLLMSSPGKKQCAKLQMLGQLDEEFFDDDYYDDEGEDDEVEERDNVHLSDFLLSDI